MSRFPPSAPTGDRHASASHDDAAHGGPPPCRIVVRAADGIASTTFRSATTLPLFICPEED